MTAKKMIAVSALYLAAGIAGGVGTAGAAVVTESVDFSGNLLPAGWSLITNLSVGNNVHIQNNRLEMGQVDSWGGITRSVNTVGVTQVKIEYDTNIANVFWGQGSGVELIHNMSNRYQENLGAGMGKSGYGLNSMHILVFGTTPQTPAATLLDQYSALNVGDYHMTSVFEDGQVSFTATKIGDPLSTYSIGVFSVAGFQLASMHNLLIYGGTTTGDSTWIDNVLVTTTSVPEPAVLLLFASAGVALAFTRRRKQHCANPNIKTE